VVKIERIITTTVMPSSEREILVYLQNSEKKYSFSQRSNEYSFSQHSTEIAMLNWPMYHRETIIEMLW
jgi:hypothetical protein